MAYNVFFCILLQCITFIIIPCSQLRTACRATVAMASVLWTARTTPCARSLQAAAYSSAAVRQGITAASANTTLAIRLMENDYVEIR